MSELLIVLSPPRSFSSIVSATIGQHPDLYGFPELRLFVGDTVGEAIEFSRQKDPGQEGGPPGLLRALAQIHDGVQTNATVLKAIAWLEARHHWPTRDLFNYLLEKISPRMGVEKTPQTSMKWRFLERAYESFPQAYYLHLTRHPVSTRTSMLLHSEGKSPGMRKEKKKNKNSLDPIYRWDRIHRDILSLTRQLPQEQTLRVKGEDLLSDPDRFLPIIADWLGVRADREAIEAMKHPENSPYACLGPDLAEKGNNLEFLKHPHLRPGPVRQPSLQEFWQRQQQEFLDEFGFPPTEGQEANEQVTELARIMGYD